MNIDFLSSPRVVATVTQADDLAFLQNPQECPCEVLEYRLDNLHVMAEETFSAMASRAEASLLTVRRPDEGGAQALPDAERLRIYEAGMPHADWIDTEIASLKSPAFSGFIQECHVADVGVVASFHDFEGFPGIELLQQKVETAFDFGAQVAKLAVVIEEMEDLFSVAQLVESQCARGRLISAMGMGSLGKLSRLVLARAGSCLNYGYLQTPNAPGQWSAEELTELLAKLDES